MSFKRLKIAALLCLGSTFALLNNAVSAEETGQIGTINGQSFTQSQLMAYARATAPRANLLDPDTRKQVLEGYIGRELLYQQAVQKKLDQLPGVKLAIEEQRHAIIARALVAQLTRSNPISDKDLRTFYDNESKKRKDDKKLPEFETIRPQLMAILQDRMVGAYVAELQKKAKLDFAEQ